VTTVRPVSRYDPLTESLSRESEDSIEFTFEDIDELVGGLPPSARKHAAWWSNGQSSHQARYWLEAGRRAKPDFMRGVIRFDRAPAGDNAPANQEQRRESHAAPAVVTTRKPVVLTPTGEHVRASISYEWQSADEVRMHGDKVVLPQLTARPGIYRFRIEHREGSVSFYVGETDNLFRRMGHYRNPGPSQQTNVRLNELLRALQNGGRAVVEIVTAALCGGESLDFALKWQRRLIENMAVVELLRVGATVDNL
jgi:hypothetical protein